MIAPGSTIGILGGGQLGRMIAQAARQHGYGVVVLAPEGDAPAAGLADHTIRASYEDSAAARQLADLADVVTYEFENVPARTAEIVAERVPVRPGVALLAVTQDRIDEHAWVHAQGVPTARGRPVRTPEDLAAAVAALGVPGRLKSARGGYDGGGQHRLTDPADRPALAGQAWLYEAEVPFAREISVVVCRGTTGETRAFPVVENVHRDGILVESTVPARLPPRVEARAVEIAHTLARAADLVGTLTVECFQVGDEVWVNELAPRVHNSGHLTIEACVTSQFEQHVRAVCGLPLGDVTLRSPAAMVNLLGDVSARRVRLLGADAALAAPDVHLHLYGKASVRPRRKMGHVTALGPTRDEALAAARRARAALSFSA